MSNASRQTADSQWNLCRFVKTLAYFGVIPVLSNFGWFQNLFNSSPRPQADAGAIAYGSATADATMTPADHRLIFDFRHPYSPIDEIWGSVDDVVMGGVSQSQVVMTDAGALFTGDVSTANSGGFASIRTRNFEPPLDLAGYDGIVLRVRGDGQRYKFLLRDESRWDGVGYSTSFDTEIDTWITVQIPFSELIPVFRARTLSGDEHVNPSKIRAFQVMLSKFEYDGDLNPTFNPGPFQLTIESIGAYRQSQL